MDIEVKYLREIKPNGIATGVYSVLDQESKQPLIGLSQTKAPERRSDVVGDFTIYRKNLSVEYKVRLYDEAPTHGT